MERKKSDTVPCWLLEVGDFRNGRKYNIWRMQKYNINASRAHLCVLYFFRPNNWRREANPKSWSWKAGLFAGLLVKKRIDGLEEPYLLVKPNRGGCLAKCQAHSNYHVWWTWRGENSCLLAIYQSVQTKVENVMWAASRNWARDLMIPIPYFGWSAELSLVSAAT